ncbi:unnamed protein product [Ixodes pacificus]
MPWLECLDATDCINHSCKTSVQLLASEGSSVEHGNELTLTAVSPYFSYRYFQGGGGGVKDP